MGMGPHRITHWVRQSIDPKNRCGKLGTRKVGRHRCPRRTIWCSTRAGGFYFTELGKRMPRHKVYARRILRASDG